MESRPDKLTTAQSARLASLSVKENSSARDLERIALEIQLRQWCVEQAKEVVAKNIVTVPTVGTVPVVDIAEQIFNFVTEPLR
jgi:regulator of PEP synthase PpsR (kinase-PPPase family)